MLRTILTSSSLLISVIVWLPSQIKILKTKSAKDYHVGSFLLILWLQVSSFMLASLDHSNALRAYFALNGCNVLLTLLMILKYR